MNRREFLNAARVLAGAAALAPTLLRAAGKPNPVLLITSGWQDVNIGDIAHTPGLLALLKSQLPDARIILWKKSKSEKVEAMLNHYYPQVRIIHGAVSKAYTVDSEAVKQAFAEADLFIHGSGPSVVAADFLQAWQKTTQKPFGIFGTTIQEINSELKALLEKASFIFTRETASIQKLKEAGLSGSHIAFAPDATFDLTIRDDAKAGAFMSANGLKSRAFICVIPRLRVTPYYKIRANSGWSEQRIQEVNALNDRWKEVDHAKLREAMIAWVRKTGNPVVVCPEMTYQVDIMDELLIDPLPADVKAKVVKHGYWLPDEAASLYTQAHCVLSFECHSPIMALTNGTPAFYLRQPEDTIKGQMYYDLQLSDWTFEINNVTGAQIAERLMSVQADYPKAQKQVKASMDLVKKRYNAVFVPIRKLV